MQTSRFEHGLYPFDNGLKQLREYLSMQNSVIRFPINKMIVRIIVKACICNIFLEHFIMLTLIARSVLPHSSALLAISE